MNNRRENAAPLVEWLGVTYRTILSSEDSSGAMSITDSVSPPASGPPRHIHHREDEAFVIISGACEFWISGKTIVRSAGETIFVPRGTEHAFKVSSAEPCRHLVILTPAGFEQFFSEMARGGHRIPVDMGAINEIAARFHLSFTGPPL